MPNFRDQVEYLVANIPVGMVMTYGQIAGLVDRPRAARQVGGIAHFGDPSLPWHRVINARGGLASGYPGGRMAHKFAFRSRRHQIYLFGRSCLLGLKKVSVAATWLIY